MVPQNWSTIPDDNLGEFDYGVKNDDDASVAVGYTHADPGYVVWTTEGKLHEGGPEARLGFHPDEEDAREHVHRYASNHAEVQIARQAVRGTGDAAKGVADPDGMAESLPWSAFGGGRAVKRRVEDAFGSPEELAEASDAHLRSFEGVGPTTVEDLREWMVEEGYADAPDEDDYTEGDVDTTVEPSGLDLDDPATEITGVGDSSNLARETVGDFWDMGCPFHEVAGAWQDEALRDILGASFFVNTQPDHLIRVFAGYTAAYGYDERGEELGNYAEAMFGQFDWNDVRWAWADHGLTTDFGEVAAASEVIEEQAAVATGDELPAYELDFDPEEDTGLSGLHGAMAAEVTHDSNSGEAKAVHYNATGGGIESEENDVYVPFETVALYSLLFSTDYSDPANVEHVRLVVDTSTSNESKRNTATSDRDRGKNNRYVAVFDHPNADVHGLAEGRLTVRPDDFDLEEPDEWDAWAAKVAEQVEERDEAFRREMQAGPNTLAEARGVAPDRQLDDAVGAHPHNDHRNADRENPNELDHFEDMMGEVYDPTEDVADDLGLAGEHHTHARTEAQTGEVARWENPEGHAVYVTKDSTVPEGRAYTVHSDRGAVKKSIAPDEVDEWVHKLAGRADAGTDESDDGDPWEGFDVLRSDEPETVYQADLDKTEQATPDEHGVLTDNEGNGYGTAGWQIVEDADDTADGGSAPYDPTDEYEELEEPSEISGIGEGRRKTLDALDEKPTLDDPQSFDSLEEMKNAVREISLAHRDGRTYLAPPEKALRAIQSTWDSLPEEAHQAFLNDHRLYVKIRAARNRFNDWMGKKRREQKIPSSMEAGPSNYPSKKAKKTAKYAREGKEELNEAIDKIRSAANGAKQRALEAIGSSVAEQNEKEAKSQIERRREAWEPGDIVVYRNPNLHAAAIVRLNKKSVRVQRRNNVQGADWAPDGEFRRETIDLDSDHITRYDGDDLHKIEDSALDRDQTVPDTLKEAQRQFLGDEWVEDHYDDQDDDQDDETTDDTDTDNMDNFVSEQASKEDPDLADRLRSEGLNNIVASNLAREFGSRSEVREAVESADDVTDLPGVGAKTADEVRALFDGDDQDDQDGSDVPDDPDPTGDREAAEEHRKAVEAARAADPDGDLPGPALSALKKAWSGYKNAAKEGHQAAEEVEEWRDARPEAAEYAAIINDIRDAYGQEPIDFDGVDGIPEVGELGGPITSDDPNVSLSFDWSADPYDPTTEGV